MNKKLNYRGFIIEYGAIVALIALVVFNMAVTRNFISINTLWLVIKQSTPILMMTIGMTFVISSGGIDISTGSMMGLSGVIVAMMLTSGVNFYLAVIVSLVICGFIGAFNGTLINAGVQPVILTLVMQIVLRGTTVMLAKSTVFVLTDKTKYPEINRFGLSQIGDPAHGVPVQLVFFIIAVAVSVFAFHKLLVGKQVEAVGSNTKAARLAGINTTKLLITVYAISAVLAALCGLLELCRNGSLDPNELGKGYELDAIAGVAIGGTNMKGGKANIIGSIAGCIIMILVGITVNMNGVPFAVANIIKAFIIIFSLAIQKEQSV